MTDGLSCIMAGQPVAVMLPACFFPAVLCIFESVMNVYKIALRNLSEWKFYCTFVE